MNNEPVAWMYQIHDITGWTWVSDQRLPDYEYRNEKPLYTHPAKTLTDEEIHNLMDEIEVLVHGDIKRAMYRMARKVESILNE